MEWGITKVWPMPYTIQYSTNDTDEREEGMAKKSADYTELGKTANTPRTGVPSTQVTAHKSVAYSELGRVSGWMEHPGTQLNLCEQQASGHSRMWTPAHHSRGPIPLSPPPRWATKSQRLGVTTLENRNKIQNNLVG